MGIEWVFLSQIYQQLNLFGKKIIFRYELGLSQSELDFFNVYLLAIENVSLPAFYHKH